MANEENFHEVRHRQVATNGITMHVAEQGDLSAPTVLLIHGFPELWLSWRHQMAALAANGYRAIAPDLRGYGDTDVPADPATYTIFHIVGDLIGLLDHLELPRVFVVGHDWGAIVAWHLCLFRPDRVKALVNMAYPYFPRHPSIKPTDRFKALGEGFYITQFQEPGRAETSIDKYGALTILKKIFSIKMENLCAPPGMEIMDFLEAPTSLPEWISEDELQYFAEKFQKNGFTGPLNYYRNFDTNWTLTAPWQGAKILVPTKFIVGDKDIGFKSFGTEMHIKSGGFKAIVPDLDVIILNGCYHFIQQEKAEEQPGRAEVSFAWYEVSTVLKKFFLIKMDNLSAPPGMEIIDFLEEPSSPLEWISKDELQYFAEKFQKNGFTGPLNYYRNIDTLKIAFYN